MRTRRLLLPAIAVAAGFGIASCGGHDMDKMGPGELMPTSPSPPAGAPVPGGVPGGATGQA